MKSEDEYGNKTGKNYLSWNCVIVVYFSLPTVYGEDVSAMRPAK
jgi:hypothetical protein